MWRCLFVSTPPSEPPFVALAAHSDAYMIRKDAYIRKITDLYCRNECLQIFKLEIIVCSYPARGVRIDTPLGQEQLDDVFPRIHGGDVERIVIVL